MPYEVQLAHAPSGYALTDGLEGERVTIEQAGFYSSQDGEALNTRLEGIPEQLIGLLPNFARRTASQIDNLLALIRRDGSTTLYVNEVLPKMHARAKGRVNMGDAVSLDDILGIERVTLDEYAIPPDCGICYVFSHRWRKGMFFDFRAIADPGIHSISRAELEVVLARCWTNLLYQHLIEIPNHGWDALFQQGWFPFVQLPQEILKQLVGWATRSRNVDELLPKIRPYVLDRIRREMIEWQSDSAIGPHLTVIERAFERYEAEDYISASHILYPRIEGILSAHSRAASSGRRNTQRVLSEIGSGIGHNGISETSLLLPIRFQEYLTKVFFADFDPANPTHGVTRNTVCHGVASAELINEKAATVAFLILLQVATVASVTRFP